MRRLEKGLDRIVSIVFVTCSGLNLGASSPGILIIPSKLGMYGFIRANIDLNPPSVAPNSVKTLRLKHL